MVSYSPTGPFTDNTPPGIDAAFLNNVETCLTALCGATGSGGTVNSLATDTNVSSDGNGNATMNSVSVNKVVISPNSHSINGSTSGTATLYQTDTGRYKRCIIVLSNFWNNGGNAQNISIPTPFTTSCLIRTHAMYQLQLLSSGSAQNIAIITNLATAGGSTSSQTNIAAYSIGISNHAIDTVSFLSGGSSGQTGIIILEGV